MFVLNNCVHDSRVLKEAKTLAHNGHEVTIVATLDPSCSLSEYRDGFKIIRVDLGKLFNNARRAVDNIDVALAKHTTRLWHIYRGFRRLANFIARPIVILYYSYLAWRVVKSSPANVYHSHDLYTLPTSYVVSRWARGKLVYDAHELYTELHYISKMERALFRLVEHILLHKLDAMITTNEFAATFYGQRYCISKPTVLMNCPAYNPHDDSVHKNGLRAILGTPPAQPIIVYSGALLQGRGLEQTIAAISLVDKGILVFLGWGQQEQLLKNLVVERDLVDRVFFVPPVAANEVPSYISSADVGIVCTQNDSLSRYYSSPNKLFEYIHAGLPIVASDFPFQRKIIEGYQIGKVCDPTSPKDISRALDWVLSDKEKYQTLKTNTQRAAMEINWQNEAKKLLGLYEGLR